MAPAMSPASWCYLLTPTVLACWAQGVPTTIQALIQPFYTACEPPSTHTLQGALVYGAELQTRRMHQLVGECRAAWRS